MTSIKPWHIVLFFVFMPVVIYTSQTLEWGTTGAFASVAVFLIVAYAGSIAVKKAREYLSDLAAEVEPYMEAPLAEVPFDKASLLLVGFMVICNMAASPFIAPRGWIVCVVFNGALALLCLAIRIFRRFEGGRRQGRLVALYVDLNRSAGVVGALPLILLLEGAPALVTTVLGIMVITLLVACYAVFFWFKCRSSWLFRFLKALIIARRMANRNQEPAYPLVYTSGTDQGYTGLYPLQVSSEAQPKQEYDQPQISYPDIPSPGVDA